MLVRLQAPPEWADRCLAAAHPVSGPFTIIFDHEAQGQVTPEQADHLIRISGLVLQRIESASVLNTTTEAPDKPVRSRKKES